MGKLLISLIYIYCFSAFSMDRQVAILWDSTETETENYSFSFPHQKLEVILNHYGFKAEYFDIQDKNFSYKKILPKNYYALITWFIDDLSKNINETRKIYKNWFKAKKKVVAFGQLGIYLDEKGQNYNLNEINKILNLVNLEYKDHQFETSLGLEIAYKKDKNLLEFERNYTNEIPKVKVFKSLSNKNNILLRIKDKTSTKISDAIVYNEHFFMISQECDIFYHPIKQFTQWRINPFFIIEWLLDNPYTPIPDTTTINGKRIFYTHIDGDAFINISHIDREKISGRILTDKIFNKYKLPTTVSFIAAELNPMYEGKKQYLNYAKEIIEKPYIELASHTYFHPLSWEVEPKRYEIEAYLDAPGKYKGGPITAYKTPNNKLDYNKEIIESINYLNRELASKNKKSNFILWSGSCEPPEIALKIASENNIINMNGGDSRFDKDKPSYSHLYPLYRKQGNYFQNYSSFSNEIPYTNNWTGPFSGQIKLIQSFENTEKPIRIKPMNLYYHFYSGERLSSLNTIDKILEYSIKKNILPIFASEYAKIIEGYRTTKIVQISKYEYKITNTQKLKTLRVDRPNLKPDYKLSKNIIGHKVINNSLYLYLGGEESSKLILTTKELSLPHIIESDYQVEKIEYNKNKISIVAKSKWKKEISFKLYGRKIKPNPLIDKITNKNGITVIHFKSFELNLDLEFT